MILYLSNPSQIVMMYLYIYIEIGRLKVGITYGCMCDILPKIQETGVAQARNVTG